MGPWTQFHHAISAIFPAWERAFAAVAMHHRPKVSHELALRIDEFVKEELAHAKAHEAYNRRNNLVELELGEFEKVRIIHRKPGLKIWLGTMVSIEHFAACMSRMQLLKFKQEENRDLKLFNWHAKEELSHKDLAIDIWKELRYSSKDLRKIALQNQAYVLKFIFGVIIKNTNWSKPANWLEMANWMWWMTKKVFFPMLTIYMPNFHPNWFNDKEVMA